MLCCICKEREATVHLTQIAGDKMQKVDLCEECAKTKGVNDPTGFSLADLLLGLGASQEIEQASGGVEVKCPRCGFTQADFKKAGRLGARNVTRRLPTAWSPCSSPCTRARATSARFPKSLRHTRDLSDRLMALQKKLNKAVEDENFEQAALLRDEIKQMSARLSNIAH